MEKARGRGQNVAGTFVHKTIRVTRRTHEYFQKFPNPTQEIRKVLDNYVKTTEGNHHESN